MRKKLKISIPFIAAIILSLFSIPVFAQSQDVVTAEVDRPEITTDEYLTLSVHINTGVGPASEPNLPFLDGFDVVGTSTSTQMSIINGSLSSEKVFHYTLRPQAKGEFIIAPISIIQNGQSYATQPIRVIVNQGNGQPQPPSQSGNPASPSIPGFPSFPSISGFPSLSGLLQNFGLDIPFEDQESVEALDLESLPAELSNYDYLVEAEVDNPTPYIGEQVTYTFRYYRPASSTGRSSYQSPEFSGFWVHPDATETNYAGQIGDRRIRMTEIKTILTPTIIGEVEIAPAEITNDGDGFSRGFTIQTEPELVTVQHLPDDAPAHFNGAVGDYSISAEVDVEQTRVNDAITFIINISGEGNLETLTDPSWDIGPEWREFDSQSSTNVHVENGVISGSRTIKQLLVPTMSGEFLLPSIQFSYFDPQLEQYQSISTDPITISVQDPGPVPSEVNINDEAPLKLVDEQLRPIKPIPTDGPGNSPITSKPGFWLLWLLPLALVIGQYSWQRRKQSINNNLGAKRKQNAVKRAKKELNRLDPLDDAYFSEVGKILINFLSDKLDRRVEGLNQAELSGLLLAHHVDEVHVDQVRYCLTLSDMGKFAPIQNVDAIQLQREVASLISDLDKIL